MALKKGSKLTENEALIADVVATLVFFVLCDSCVNIIKIINIYATKSWRATMTNVGGEYLERIQQSVQRNVS